MKIVSPISRVTEIPLLAAAGASEFYCGFLTREWVERFNSPTANRRAAGNISCEDDLAAAIQTAHDCNCTISLVLNAQQYSDPQRKAAIEIGKKFTELGGDALIVSDIDLITSLADAISRPRIHVSSVATCRNVSSARLYKELGATRIILPRDVTIAEALEMAAELPELEIECFILNDGCVYEEGACHTIHLPSNMGGPICLDSYKYQYRDRRNKSLSDRASLRLEEIEASYKKWLWYRFSCGFSNTPTGLPYGPCGLCAIHDFYRGGISAIKIAGREGRTERKIASVKMARGILDQVIMGFASESIMKNAKNLRPSVEQCNTGYMCYYPEIITL